MIAPTASQALLMFGLFNYEWMLASPIAWIALAFTIWMLVDAIRREEWFWVIFIVIFPLFNAVLYYLLVYRNASPLPASRFELPGQVDRRRINDLQAQIHHLDKAHHHSQLGDIYFQQGKFAEAERCYRNAIERDPEDQDTRAHLGQTLLRLGNPEEALPLLEKVCQENPKHDYGYSLMALAETCSALGQQEKAIQIWQQVVENHSYARARLELAELHLAAGQTHLARARLQEAVADDVHAPAFERRHERYWVRRAKKRLAQLGSDS
jgi:tetratricopeptide (TPR) repeat protein